MQRAYQAMVEQFGLHATLIQVDGNRCPKFELPCEAIVKGDSKVAEISAASILAKTARDASLLVLVARVGAAALRGARPRVMAVSRWGAVLGG
jgi:ribonuclease HII